MNPINNPYAPTLIQKGYSSQELREGKRPTRTLPCTIGLRTFNTESEYQEALHDFLNGY